MAGEGSGFPYQAEVWFLGKFKRILKNRQPFSQIVQESVK